MGLYRTYDFNISARGKYKITFETDDIIDLARLKNIEILKNTKSKLYNLHKHKMLKLFKIFLRVKIFIW